jgi:hypothetical protein
VRLQARGVRSPIHPSPLFYDIDCNFVGPLLRRRGGAYCEMLVSESRRFCPLHRLASEPSHENARSEESSVFPQ